MKILKHKMVSKLIFAALIGVFAVSCKKDEATNGPLPRFFTPGTIKTTNGETQAKIEWNASLFTTPKSVKYTVQVSKTTAFSTVDYTVITDTTAISVTDANVAIKQDYYVRIKANGANGSEDSNWMVNSSPFRITGEQIFLAIDAANLTDKTVILKWRPTAGLTKIVLTKAGGTATDIALIASDLTANQKSIAALTASSTYTAEIFAGAISKGTITFTTASGLPTGPNVVYVSPTDDLPTMIQNVVSGTMFVLLKGTVYKTDNAIVVPNGVSFTIWGEDAPNKAVLAFNGFTLPATTGTIRFENIDLTGYQENDPTKTKRNYIFNQSTANVTAEINFENCTIRNFVNTPMRLQGSAVITIDKFTVNKGIVYDIGDNGSNGTYAFINNNVATSKINNIKITNSTFYKLGYGLIVHNLAPSQTVVIDNNTFYNTTGDARYFIDYNAQVVSSSFTFNNNIFGKTLSPANTARGIRCATVPTVNNSYKTSDATFAAGPITGINDYTGNSASLFTDPANGVFTIKDASFAGKATAGDPRWR